MKIIYTTDLHMPPSKLGLDVCQDGTTVGSDSVYDFIRNRQPLFSLHGHIHESPDVSGKWKNKVGNTIAIQPGQLKQFTFVVIDTETKTVRRQTI
jgi:Icc-related predicted phosphoesterase